jgi:hypothetical protein
VWQQIFMAVLFFWGGKISGRRRQPLACRARLPNGAFAARLRCHPDSSHRGHKTACNVNRTPLQGACKQKNAKKMACPQIALQNNTKFAQAGPRAPQTPLTAILAANATNAKRKAGCSKGVHFVTYSELT